jgi:cell division septation protein DedD
MLDYAKRLRDSHAFLAFLGGVILLLGFFAAGAYIGRWSRMRQPAVAPAEQQQTAPQAASSDRLLIDVAAFETREQAEDLVAKLRRKYTSAHAEAAGSPRMYHVYVGPYVADEATTVAEELRQQEEIEVLGVIPYQR